MPDEVPVSVAGQRLRETEQLLREAFAAAALSITPTAIHVPRPDDRPERCWSRWLPLVRDRRRSWDRRLRLPRLYEQVLIPLAAAAAITVGKYPPAVITAGLLATLALRWPRR